MKRYNKNKSVILGVELSKLNLNQTLELIDKFLNSSKSHKIFTPNPEICLKASKDKQYKKILNSADINIPDGFGLKVGGAILGQKVPHRITGVDLTYKLLKQANDKKLKIMLLGGKGDTAKKAAKNIKKDFTGLQIVGAGEGIQIKYEKGKISYDRKQNQNILNFINQVKPDILFVAFGAPKQEYWIYENIFRIKSVKLVLGVGGTLDFIAGKIKRAPKWMRKIGFEWLFRFIQEPRRIKRILNALILFPLTCIKWLYGWNFRYRKNASSIIFNHKGEILIIYNPRFHYWTLPQGAIEKKENHQQASLREIDEELGIRPNKLQFIKIPPVDYTYKWPKWSKLIMPFKGQKQKFVFWKFTGSQKDFDYKKSDEVKAVQWVKKENLLAQVAKVRHESIKKIYKYL